MERLASPAALLGYPHEGIGVFTECRAEDLNGGQQGRFQSPLELAADVHAVQPALHGEGSWDKPTSRRRSLSTSPRAAWRSPVGAWEIPLQTLVFGSAMSPESLRDQDSTAKAGNSSKLLALGGTGLFLLVINLFLAGRQQPSSSTALRPMMLTPAPANAPKAPAAPTPPLQVAPVAQPNQSRALSSMATREALVNRSPQQVLESMKAHQRAAVPSGITRPKVGETARLATNADTGFVPVAESEFALVEFAQAVAANDGFGIGQLMDRRQLVLVEQWTRALVLTPERGQASSIHRVRLVDGRYQNEVVFIAAVWARL